MAGAGANIEAREQYGPRVFKIRAREGQKPLELARKVSDRCGRLPIWSLDLPNPKDDPKLKGRKRFEVASYSAFRDLYRETSPVDRCYYEIILKDLPTRVYVDVDAQLSLNPTLSPAVINEMLGVLTREIFVLMAEISGNKSGVGYVGLDSSKASKLSKHIVFDFFLRNNYHCGAFMRIVRNRISTLFEKAPGVGDRDSDHPYYLWAKVKDPTKPNSGETMLVRTFFADLAVYTKRRNFRIYGSSKRIPGALPLLAEGENGFSWDTFNRCILQRCAETDPVFDCLESDGSVPTSTSDTNFLRIDGVKAASAARKKQKKSTTVSAVFTESTHLSAHWSNVFPFDVVFNIFAPLVVPSGSGGGGGENWRREFRFADVNNKWTVARYFSSAADLRAAVLTALPAAVHIGPVRDSRSSAKWDSEPFQPSIVFDVDINDYAKFRPCCGDTGAACGKCWPIAAFAQTAVAEFVAVCGLGTPVCFFSGSKGVHIWVVGQKDRAVALVGAPARQRLIDFFESVKQRTETAPESGPDDVAMADVGYEIPSGQAVCGLAFVQNALGDEQNRRRLAAFICDDMGLRSKFRSHEAVHGRDSAILQVLWPRLDKDVTASPSHKIKAPFCVHPHTSRVCVWLREPGVNPYVDNIDVAENAAALAEFCGSLV
jgi:DNA primase small subunit